MYLAVVPAEELHADSEEREAHTCAFASRQEARHNGDLLGAAIGSGQRGSDVGEGLLIAYICVGEVIRGHHAQVPGIILPRRHTLQRSLYEEATRGVTAPNSLQV